eukprot:scaffold244_cov172-Amphora_coffeaeformis.AAC.41
MQPSLAAIPPSTIPSSKPTGAILFTSIKGVEEVWWSGFDSRGWVFKGLVCIVYDGICYVLLIVWSHSKETGSKP